MYSLFMANRVNPSARFDQIARHCGPAVTDAQIWDRVRQEGIDADARSATNRSNADWCNEQDAAAHAEFAAADLANDWG